MAVVTSVETVVPQHTVTREEMREVAAQWLTDDAPARERFERIVANSGVANRFFCFSADNILRFNGLHDRSERFTSEGTRLLRDAAMKVIHSSGVAKSDFSHLLFTSCSVPVIPSIDTLFIQAEGLPPTIRRVPIYQHGCAGGVIGLGLAARLAALGDPVLTTAVEICSLVFQPENHAGTQLVGAAIFGDGAAAAVISPGDEGICIIDSRSFLIPDSYHLMGYDIFDDGFHLRLDRSLPQMLADYAPAVTGEFLGQHGLGPKDVDFWLFHPGGIRILDYFDSVFGLDPAAARWSREVLRDCGNLSSATVLFVLKRFLDSGEFTKGKRALMVGVGPGLTLEVVLFEAR